MNQRAGSLEAKLAAAAAARQRGQSAEELRHLEDALRIAPGNPHALNTRGMRALADGDVDLAERCFSGAASADPGEPALWMNLATARRTKGDEDGEQQSLERALDIDRRNFMALLRLAELQQRRGRIAEAAQRWQDVVHMALAMPERPPVVVDALSRGQAFLADHNRELGFELDRALGADIATLGPDARRFAACVDHALGRRRIYRNECSGLHYPFLPADEFFDRRHFPWFAEIEAKTDLIREEAIALLARNDESIRPYVRQEPGTPPNKWSPLDNSLDWGASFLWEYGERNDRVCALCPETAAALDRAPQSRVPGKAPSAFFSVLKPGAHIPPHTGVTNTRAIIHLPLIVPPGCRFRVGGETREWKVGEAFAFDDTIEHEAWNDSNEPRVILIFDVWNPHLTLAEQNLLAGFFDVVAKQA